MLIKLTAGLHEDTASETLVCMYVSHLCSGASSNTSRTNAHAAVHYHFISMDYGVFQVLVSNYFLLTWHQHQLIISERMSFSLSD